MTDCNRQPLTFSSLGPKSVVADFLGGRLTSDAGALLLREMGQKTGLFEAIDAVIPDPRNPVFVIHDQRSMIAQRIVAIALGYEDLNDHQTLRGDPALQLAAGRVPDEELNLASPPTLCRLENRIERRTLIRISEVLVDQFIASHAQPPEHLILDFDATDDPVHGRQEGRFFHGYYDHYCYLPLYVFCGDELVTAYLRPSKIDASKHSRALLKLLVGRLRRAWPGVRITIRADSGFCRWKTMRWCDSHGIGYVLGLARNPALERLAADRMSRRAATSRRRISRSGSSARSPTPPRLGTGSDGSSREPSTRSRDPAHGSSWSTSRVTRGNSTRTSTASGARWKAGSRSSSWTYSPTGPVVMGSWPISSGCCSRRRGTC